MCKLTWKESCLCPLKTLLGNLVLLRNQPPKLCLLKLFTKNPNLSNQKNDIKQNKFSTYNNLFCLKPLQCQKSISSVVPPKMKTIIELESLRVGALDL